MLSASGGRRPVLRPGACLPGHRNGSDAHSSDKIRNDCNQPSLSAQKAVELDPELGQAHRALSSVLEQEGNLAQAREEAFRAIELDGIDERTAGRVATIAKTLGRPDIALRWCEIMKRLQPHPAGNEFIIGDCWTDLCEDERAEEAYRQTTELRPEMPEGWIGICHLRLLEGDFTGAMQVCTANEKDFAQFNFSPEMAAQVYFFARQFNKSSEDLRGSCQRDPDGRREFFRSGQLSVRARLVAPGPRREKSRPRNSGSCPET